MSFADADTYFMHFFFFFLHHALLYRKCSLTRLFAAPTLPGTTDVMIIFVCWVFFPREKEASAINRKMTLLNSRESNVGYALKYLPALQQWHALQRKITRFRQWQYRLKNCCRSINKSSPHSPSLPSAAFPLLRGNTVSVCSSPSHTWHMQRRAHQTISLMCFDSGALWLDAAILTREGGNPAGPDAPDWLPGLVMSLHRTSAASGMTCGDGVSPG